MNRTRALTAGAVAAGILGISIFASPYWELHRLHSAIQRRDADAISEHVDFPALRESFKGQMMAAITNQTGNETASKNPFAALGQTMAMAVINPLVDAMVSPAGVSAMIESGKARLPKPGEAAGEQPSSDEKVDYSVSYRSWEKVAVSSKKPDAGSFIFKRYGLWSWKLAAIQFHDKPTAGRRQLGA